MNRLPLKRSGLRTGRTTVAAGVARQIRGLILHGRLPAGQAIPSQRELSRRLGVSVPAVREALKNLEAVGLIEIRHGRRTVVKLSLIHI